MKVIMSRDRRYRSKFGGRILPPPDAGTVRPPSLPKLPARTMRLRRSNGRSGRRDRSGPPRRWRCPLHLPPSPAPAQIVAAADFRTATQIAFTAPYKVTVAAGQSLMLPLLDRDLPARRIDLYPALGEQPATRSPRSRSTNDSGSGLPPGVLTLYQQSRDSGALYLGDARLAALPAGDKRLLSYALDSKVTIDRGTAERRPIVKIPWVSG